ncbi:hypothetical protein B0T49_06950 [Chromobacterium violaceum]|uniref:hypothetical protein n=1 Tax=Chromobacterium violaceum TaxID=536 RepID=UPI0009D91FD8|nr:hypothetical protein [Chromobacterium violaceum]OQS46892.1 hypothetical protein B0T48_13920 [Chromobacterium violaceum]OQS51735.1 hypothetical protein B0T49_06950 [Chromobacterium violaceum]
MSEAAANTAPQKLSLGPNQCVVVGRIKERRAHGGHVFTTIIQPAPDEYSMPGIVEVRSKKSLGQAGDDVRQLCQCSGYTNKPFESKDKDTGEIVVRRTVSNVFVAIEP